jgi:polyhydroxybutyrate depolymerase
MKRKSRNFLNVFLILSALILSGCSFQQRTDIRDQLPPGWTERSLEHDGLTRWYRIYIPDPLPENPTLVLYLHGGTLSMRSLFSPLVDSTKTWLRLAEEQKLILLVPNGVNPETGDTYGDDQNWNDLRPHQAEGQTRVDDVGFLTILLDEVSRDLSLTPDHVYVTGASNGGMMTYRLLIEAPEHFSAGAVFIANLPDLDPPLPTPDLPRPIMIANGTEDPLVPWEGGTVARDRGLVLSAEKTVDWWVTANQADPNWIETNDLADLNPNDDCQIQSYLYPAQEGGAPVLFYAVRGGGHTLPSLAEPRLFDSIAKPLFGPVCRDADGVLLAWDFFTTQGLEQ